MQARCPPEEYGEVFVLDDGGEVDLDLGNYERYSNVKRTRKKNIKTGKTVQIVPYLRNAIRNWVERVAIVAVDETGVEPNVSIIELGGAVGDIESPLFLESVRWLRGYTGKDNFVHIHVSLVPQTNGEQQKTKPTKHAIASFLGAGLVPDPVEEEQMILVHDIGSTYHVPMLLEQQGVISLLTGLLILEKLGVSEALRKQGDETWKAWKSLTGAPP
ncbi:MAG: CTP synthase ura7 [Stictis urceolatum]|nr:CTP synthase ura7 [Stictis urceolata]